MPSCHEPFEAASRRGPPGTNRESANGVRYEQPAVFVVEVRDGLITRHWDFVDYCVGPID